MALAESGPKFLPVWDWVPEPNSRELAGC
jgi:hypothetical protein